MKEKSAAIVTIKDAGQMTRAGRKAIAEWLRNTARDLVKYGDQYDKGFRARYLYR